MLTYKEWQDADTTLQNVAEARKKIQEAFLEAVKDFGLTESKIGNAYGYVEDSLNDLFEDIETTCESVKRTYGIQDSLAMAKELGGY